MKQSATPMIHSLSTLLALREREVERLQAELAAKEAMRQRYVNNLARLETLCQQGSAASSPALAPALSLNHGHYKQAVLEMAEAHRLELTLHEADMAVTQRALGDAWFRQEVLGKVLHRQAQRAQSEQERQARKRQDEVAVQMWQRGRA